jgi:hypothetical protein
MAADTYLRLNAAKTPLATVADNGSSPALTADKLRKLEGEPHGERRASAKKREMGDCPSLSHGERRASAKKREMGDCPSLSPTSCASSRANRTAKDAQAQRSGKWVTVPHYPGNG